MVDWPLVVAGLVAENVREALTADIVFAVWRDRKKPVGVDYLMLKGEAIIAEIESARRSVSELSLSSVRVSDRAEATVLQKMVQKARNGPV